MDHPIQMTVKRKPTGPEKYQLVCLVAICFLIFSSLFELREQMGYFAILAFAAAIGVVYLMLRYVLRFNIVYSYETDGSSLTVTRITNKRKTEEMVRVGLNQLDYFYAFDYSKYEDCLYDKVMFACEAPANPMNRALEYTHGGLKTLLLITPTREFAQALSAGVPEDAQEPNPQTIAPETEKAGE